MFEVKKPFSSIKNNAEDAKKTRVYRRIIPPFIAVAVILLVLIYIVSLLFSRLGSFTISVKDFGNREYALALCENDEFKKPVSRLNAAELREANNITYTNLPNDLNDSNGSHNGEDYLAYTFYIKNTGEKTCSYKYSLIITRATLGIDAAVRVRIYFNSDYYKAASDSYDYSSKYTEYAKPKTGGGGLPEVDPGNRTMTNFLSNDVIVENQIDNFYSGDIAKVTVVIWLEGEDADCNNDVLGGQFKTDMVIQIVGA